MNEKISIGNLIDKIKNIMDVTTKVVQDRNRIRPEKSEVDELNCDNTKLIKYTKWKPNYSLDIGLKETIEWIRDNLSFFKPNEYNI